jgi:succinate dehydrogenase / fumarate reductase, cytochrome b subunit
MAHQSARPLSPHLTIWRWGPHMLVSILHRVTGNALAIGAGLIFAWWIMAAATSARAYAIFYAWIVEAQSGAPAEHLVNLLARLVGVGLTWAIFQHMATGVRHFVLDVGAGYELKTNKNGARGTIVFSVLATLAYWGFILGTKF